MASTNRKHLSTMRNHGQPLCWQFVFPLSEIGFTRILKQKNLASSRINIQSNPQKTDEPDETHKPFFKDDFK